MNADKRRWGTCLVLAMAAVCASVAAAGPPGPAGPTGQTGPTGPTIREGPDEVLYLDGLADPNRWPPAECTVSASKDLRAEGRPTLHMHIPVDHKGGEKNYPVGWPRAYVKLRPAERQWGGFERFEFLIHARMSRQAPPNRVLNLQIQCPDRARTYSRNLAEVRLGQWVRVSIPLHEIPNVAEVAGLGLNISESDYRDGDKLDFFVGGFRLARAAEFSLARLAIRSRVMYADRPALSVEVEAVGPPDKIAAGLPLTVHQGGPDGKVLGRQTVAVSRGLQTVAVDVGKLKLPPGQYTLAAFDEDPARRKAGTFRVVESPWQEAKP